MRNYVVALRFLTVFAACFQESIRAMAILSVRQALSEEFFAAGSHEARFVIAQSNIKNLIALFFLNGRYRILSTCDFQSEVGEVFGEIGGELPAKFGRRFSSFFFGGKSSEAFSTKTPPQISPSNFTTRIWVVAGP